MMQAPTPTVYFSKNELEVPIVIDTGASVTLTPNPSDFIGEMKPCTTTELKGLKGSTEVVGQRKVEVDDSRRVWSQESDQNRGLLRS